MSGEKNKSRRSDPDTGKAGEVKCLKCRKPFRSPDKTRVRLCPYCRGKADDLPGQFFGSAA